MIIYSNIKALNFPISALALPLKRIHLKEKTEHSCKDFHVNMYVALCTKGKVFKWIKYLIFKEYLEGCRYVHAIDSNAEINLMFL